MSYAPFDLTGKVALITGGNSGIGLGMADAIARAGGAVCIWGTNPDQNADALAQLEAHGGTVAALLCDISDEGAVEKCFAETLERFGHVDGCFANAGVSAGQPRIPFVDMTTQSWERIINVNLYGSFFTLRAAARHMIERAKGGRLVATSSLAAVSGAASNEHYVATKGALVSMIYSLAVEMGRHGITANAILPGWIETGMTQGAFSWEKFVNAVKPRIPARRWGTGDDFGGIAVYLMSDASAYHSGDTLVIDGAYHKF